MQTMSPAVAAESTMVPSGRFPALIRSSTVSMPWLTAFSYQVQHRIHHPLDHELVDFRGLPAELHADTFPGFARQIAHHERHPAENFSDRHQPDAHDPLAQRAELPIDHNHVFLNRPPLPARNVRFDTREGIREPRAPDHEIPTLRISSSSRARSTRTN